MKNALVVVDVQEYFLNKYTKHLPQKIVDFVGKNKSRFDYVVFFKFQNRRNSNWSKILGWNEMFKDEKCKLAPKLNSLSSKGNIFIKKASFSIFRSVRFNKFLKEKKITNLFLCGLDTDACVYVSIFEAFERGYDVKVIENLCASHWGIKQHNEAIAAIKRNLSGKIITKV